MIGGRGEVCNGGFFNVGLSGCGADDTTMYASSYVDGFLSFRDELGCSNARRRVVFVTGDGCCELSIIIHCEHTTSHPVE